MESFTRTALRAGAGDDVGSLTSTAKRKRFTLDGRSLRLVAIFVTVLGLSAMIAALSSRSVEVSAIEPVAPCEAGSAADHALPEAAGSSGSLGPSPSPPARGEGSGWEGSAQAGSAQGSTVQENSAGPGEVVVHVSGQVNSPGVVTIAAPGRVIDAVEEAGGPTPEADLALINLAEPIVDGAHIHVPAHGEGEAIAGVAGGGEPPAASGDPPGAGVNINTASQAELETIPGVGPVTAQAIIAWREDNGAFSSVEQLIDVNGIGPKTLEQLRDHVRVS